MSEYLTLSEPGAVSLLSPESASVNSSSVIRLSFEPASVGVLSSPFQTAFLPSSLQYCSTGIYEVGGVGVHSAALHLSVELPEVSECCVSIESVTEVFPLSVTGHSLEHFCLFFHERFNSQVWVWLASFFLPQFHHCPLVSPRCLSFLVPPGWLDGGFLSWICCVSWLVSSQL